MHRRHRARLLVVPVVVVIAQAFAPGAGASHSWGGYHWARTANPFTLQLGDNVSSAWDSYLDTASTDWSRSTVLDTNVVAGSTSARRCSPTAGRVEVCNSSYGANRWLGLASVWVSGSHITQGTVKLNDYYYAFSKYNTPAWRHSVMCQEIGHTFGLSHNDEDFSTVNKTCMDYANDVTENQHPNTHDYDQLSTIYGHLDSTNTAILSAGASNRAAADINRQDDWGQAVRYTSDGRPVMFERNLGGDERLFTFVVWAT